MNTELKALISLVVGIVKAGIDIYERKNLFTIFENLKNIAGCVLPVIQNWANLQNEVKELSGTEQEKDLISFIARELNIVVTDPKAQQVLTSSMKIVSDLTLDSNSLIQTIQALKGTQK